jgi:predicted nucleic acid-binding protein
MRADVVVVDTSIALKWVLDEPDSPMAADLLSEWVSRGVIVLAPALLVYEVANALYQNVRQNVIPLARTSIAIAALYRIGLTIDPAVDPALSILAVQLAQQLGLGPAYDTQFLALAEQEDCEYWTADQRFWTTTRAAHPRVRWLGERASSVHP